MLHTLRVGAILIGIIPLAGSVVAEGHPESTLERCLHSANKIRVGDFIKVEFLNPAAEGMPTYEVEVRDNAGREWEFMCDARDGVIYEIEQEVDSADDDLFKSRAQISLDQAQAAVLRLYPGTIEEVEYEIESNGDPTFEIDVVDEAGTEFKVEVDAVSGDVIEVAVEEWEIGEESDETK